MPNPQVHVAVGMLGAFLIAFLFSYFLKWKYGRGTVRSFMLFLPLIILIGAGLSEIPDVPELGRDFPSVAEQIDLDYHDKPLWNTPAFNVFFLHPYLDSKFGEQYDTTGLIITLTVFNLISLIYLYMKNEN